MKEREPLTKRGRVPARCAAALFAVAFLLANVPGNPVVHPRILSDGQYGPHFACGVVSVVHGWPCTFLRHDGVYAPTGPAAWRVGSNPQFAVTWLVLDLALLVAGTCVVGWLVRRRIQTHGWRFGIIHLMLAMLCLSAALAFFMMRSRLRQAQISYLEQAQQNSEVAEWRPFGPHWLRQITGPGCWQWGDRLVGVDLEHSDDIANLPGKKAIKVLRIVTVKCEAMPSMDDYRSLLAINMSLVNYDYSTFTGDGDPEFWPCLRVIAQRASLQGLNLYEAGVTDRGLEEIAGMPELIHLDLSENPGVTDAGVAHLASLPSLRKLGLRGTSVTAAGVETLQQALPDCEIGWDESLH